MGWWDAELLLLTEESSAPKYIRYSNFRIIIFSRHNAGYCWVRVNWLYVLVLERHLGREFFGL